MSDRSLSKAKLYFSQALKAPKAPKTLASSLLGSLLLISDCRLIMHPWTITYLPGLIFWGFLRFLLPRYGYPMEAASSILVAPIPAKFGHNPYSALGLANIHAAVSIIFFGLLTANNSLNLKPKKAWSFFCTNAWGKSSSFLRYLESFFCENENSVGLQTLPTDPYTCLKALLRTQAVYFLAIFLYLTSDTGCDRHGQP